MAISIPEVLKKAISLEKDETIELVFKDQSKLQSFRAAFYRLKKEREDETFDIFLSVKKLTITIYKKDIDFNDDEEDFVMEIKNKSSAVNNTEKVIQVNIDEKRIKTIREKLSLFDKEKELLIEKFRSCKLEIESQDDISEEDKQFLIGRSLEIVNNEIEKLNIKAREIAQESRKVKD